MHVLGISGLCHDSAAALIEDGRVAAAVQEERFTRVKRDARFPSAAIRYCLDTVSARLRDMEFVVFYEKPFLKFERLVETSLACAPRGYASYLKSVPVWLKEKLFQRRLLIKELHRIDPDFDDAKLLFSEHHYSHAASAYYPSPFESAAILTIDGVGEWCTTTVALGNAGRIEIVKEINFPHSLGLLYSAFSSYLGFRRNSGEQKLMELASYGEPRFHDLIRDNLIDLKVDGSFRLDMTYFDFSFGAIMTNEKFDRLFGLPAREGNCPLNQHYLDIAASAQAVLVDAVLALTRGIAADYAHKDLCLAGGVALNSVANGKILRDGRFERIWIQPAAGVAGAALGAALAGYYAFNGHPFRGEGIRVEDFMEGALLGPSFSQKEIEQRLAAEGACFYAIDDEAMLLEQTALALADRRTVGWFQGRMEFGPHALGNRSVLADPRSADMQNVLNLKIKCRENFRPVAPAVLVEDVSDWFDLHQSSPYMLLVAKVAHHRRRTLSPSERGLTGLDKLKALRSEIPAVTHVDCSASVQTVHRQTNPRFHGLLSAFKRRTGCPLLANTSLNVHGEPIANTPEDAFRCFMGTEMDMLVIGNCVLHKERQHPSLVLDYRNKFHPG